MKRQRGEILMHVRYLRFCSKVVAAANRDWRARGVFGDVLLTRAGLSSHLRRWGVEQGWLDEDERDMDSFLAAGLFKRRPADVLAEARRYWRKRFTEELVA